MGHTVHIWLSDILKFVRNLKYQLSSYFYMLNVWQKVEDMLKVDGPDWQKVLAYVESIFRHFEMWGPFLSSSAWFFSMIVTEAWTTKELL